MNIDIAMDHGLLSITSEIQNLHCLPDQLLADLAKPDHTAESIATRLAETFDAAEFSRNPKTQQRTWELVGLFYRYTGRPNQALAVFAKFYDHILCAQERLGCRFDKATPLVWMSDCYFDLGFSSTTRRYLMLTLIEDAIEGRGRIGTNTGVYPRLVSRGWLSEPEFERYATEASRHAQESPDDARFPEYVLQELDRNWMATSPSAQEASTYAVNRRYVRRLLANLGDGSGFALEDMADYLMACIPGCRTKKRQRTSSTDYDIVCSLDSLATDFRSELGRYFVCECKDWKEGMDAQAVRSFFTVIKSIRSNFGIAFSKNGLTGAGRMTDGELEQFAAYKQDGVLIVVIDESVLKRVSQGEDFIRILRAEYEKVRLNLRGQSKTVRRRVKTRGK